MTAEDWQTDLQLSASYGAFFKGLERDDRGQARFIQPVGNLLFEVSQYTDQEDGAFHIEVRDANEAASADDESAAIDRDDSTKPIMHYIERDETEVLRVETRSTAQRGALVGAPLVLRGMLTVAEQTQQYVDSLQERPVRGVRPNKR
jgi:hypothetical protein